MSRFAGTIIFLTGAALGGFATWLYARKRYEQIIRDEVDAMRAAMTKRTVTPTLEVSDETNAVHTQDKPSVIEYATKLRNQRYTPYSDSEVSDTRVEATSDEAEETPYVISPDEFGTCEGYELIGFTYYADGVLTDENDEVINQPETLLGPEALTSFGEYEDDSVFVRNDRLNCDYEVLLDQRVYADIPGPGKSSKPKKPHEVEA